MQNNTTTKGDNVARAIVDGHSCSFHFPIQEMGPVWTWGGGPDSCCEYSWRAIVSVDEETYEIGFLYFNDRSSAAVGTLADLIASGQTDLWKCDGNECADVMEGVQVNCEVSGHHLCVDLDDEEWVQILFGNKPEVVVFETGGTKQSCSVTYVTVEYKPQRYVGLGNGLRRNR